MSRDPLGIWGDEAQGGNGQSYCENNPVNRTDPIGLLSVRVNTDVTLGTTRSGPAGATYPNRETLEADIEWESRDILDKNGRVIGKVWVPVRLRVKVDLTILLNPDKIRKERIKIHEVPGDPSRHAGDCPDGIEWWDHILVDEELVRVHEEQHANDIAEFLREFLEGLDWLNGLPPVSGGEAERERIENDHRRRIKQAIMEFLDSMLSHESEGYPAGESERRAVDAMRRRQRQRDYEELLRRHRAGGCGTNPFSDRFLPGQ